MTVQHVQDWTPTSGNNTAVSTWDGSRTSAGSLLVVRFAIRDPAFTGLSITDPAGNDWQEAARYADPETSTAIVLLYATDTQPINQFTVTVTGADGESAPAGGYHALLSEFQGVLAGPPEDVASVAVGQDTLSDPITVTTETDGALVVAAGSAGVTNRTWTAVPPGVDLYVLRNAQITSLGQWYVAGDAGEAGASWERMSGSPAGIGAVAAAFTADPDHQAPLAVSVGTDQTISAEDSATLAAVVTGGSGDRTYQWSVESGPPGDAQFGHDDSQMTTFDPSGVPGVYVLRCTVTDSTGTAHDELTLTVLRSLTSLPMAALNTADGWTPTGPAALAAVSDSDDSTAITSGPDPTDTVLDFTAPPLALPDQPFVARIRARHRDATTGTVTGHLYVGDTLHSTSDPADITDTYEWVDLTFPLADLDGITEADWQAGVRVTYTITAS